MDDELDDDTIECSQCGESFYDDSPRCPHCGHYPTAMDHSRFPVWFRGVVIVLILALLLPFLLVLWKSLTTE